MATGVTVHDDAISKYAEFKKQSNPSKFIIFKIDSGKVVLDGETSEDSVYETFLSRLPGADCRYAVYKMNYTTNDGRAQTKLVFISWAPDTAPVKAKMIYAGSKDALNRALEGIMVKVSGTDFSEVAESVLQDACKRLG